jgi:hypothetical protein
MSRDILVPFWEGLRERFSPSLLRNGGLKTGERAAGERSFVIPNQRILAVC